MYATNEIPPSCHVMIRSDSEDSLKVAEPNIPSALAVKVPPFMSSRNLRCHEFGIFQLGADVRTEKKSTGEIWRN